MIASTSHILDRLRLNSHLLISNHFIYMKSAALPKGNVSTFTCTRLSPQNVAKASVNCSSNAVKLKPFCLLHSWETPITAESVMSIKALYKTHNKSPLTSMLQWISTVADSSRK